MGGLRSLGGDPATRGRHFMHAELNLIDLHTSLDSPVIESMNFLNEVAQRFPKALSLAAGRPYEGFFDTADMHRHLRVFEEYLLSENDGDVTRTRRTLLQYGRTKGIIHGLIAKNLSVDENIEVDPESVVVTVGCQEALFLTLRALRRSEEDVLLAPMPCYVGATGAAELADMRVLPVKESADGIDLDDLVRVAEEAKAAGLRPRACYVVADFANPSGVSLSRDARESLLRLADEHDFLVLEDNPYGIFQATGIEPLPTLKSLDRDRRVVYLGSFAKTGLPGARIGFVVADQQVATAGGRSELFADQLAKIKSMLTVNTSPVAQAVIGGKLLENDCSLRAANVRETELYQGNLRHLVKELERNFPEGSRPEVTWNTPAGGFFVVVTVPFPVDDELLEHSARRHRVLWTPMHHFYGDGRPRRQIRLSFSYLSPGDISVGVDRLAEFIREQCGV
ncbi:PLP-dependent aminotransferase family protein [Streptomyces sp. NPDC086554]|uniref:aminotransferase-like domain-containing protein n=1 Tax=Streptomyces sp. NPDC086554 TaxID=3154864 RepID=UPI0034452232